MPHDSRPLVAKLGWNAETLARRRAFFEITDEDLARLASLRPFAERVTDQIVDDFYGFLLAQPEGRQVFADDASVERARRAQRRYFVELFSGRLDLDYIENRLRVGATHERLGVAPTWYLGAYGHYLRVVARALASELPDSDRLVEAFRSIQKVVWLDISLAMETYVVAHLETVARHQAAIRELSTPVIRLFDRILLLPLIGTIDTQRAQQVMEAILLRVVAEQAKVIIVDIAGVPVVDTTVADHLLKTTAAIRLLGAETVLTGISPHVARTVTELGVDIGAMTTRSRLADGIEYALSRVGKVVRDG